MINRRKVFDTELQMIQNGQIRDFTLRVIEAAPEYWFTEPASSTGKYHPAYATGDGGLIRHTKAAAHILNDLLNLEQFQVLYGDDERDCMLSAIILHDSVKHGFGASSYTTVTHPLDAAKLVQDVAAKGEVECSAELIEFICKCISSHMGQWNSDYRSKKEVLPKPETMAEQLVHLADYLASRKYLTFEFGDDWYDPKKFVSAEDSSIKAEITSVCKAKIASGVDREVLYDKIVAVAGVRNYNSIKDVSVLEKVLEAVKEA